MINIWDENDTKWVSYNIQTLSTDFTWDYWLWLLLLVYTTL